MAKRPLTDSIALMRKIQDSIEDAAQSCAAFEDLDSREDLARQTDRLIDSMLDLISTFDSITLSHLEQRS